ncbi:Sec23-binding domain of Sec16-domain-containing protein [Chiua virens]|nr:Sec23-binding domain of Sec16-domain-containing protein [Chiua virens]
MAQLYLLITFPILINHARSMDLALVLISLSQVCTTVNLTTPVEHDIHVSRTRPPYAPSPSLLGSNDPLGRTSSRAPVINFGFGGKVLTCFHNSDLNTGFDVALSSRRTTTVKIRVLHQLLPDYASESKAAEYPGPLISDPGTPVTSLVRTGTSQAKLKKARVIKYLEERAEEIQRGTMYISDSIEKQRLEEKLTLVQLLKIMVENDGSLSGSPAIDKAVRAALLPRIAGTMDGFGRDGPLGLTASGLTSPVSNAYGATSTPSPGKEAPISVSTLLPSSLDKIQEFLVRGERREAYHYALDQRLWAHAMIIANSIDKEAWKEVVNEFLKAELGIHESLQRATPRLHGKNTISQQTNGREWLRVAYSVFSGQGPNAVQELVPPNLLSKPNIGLPVSAPSLPHVIPVSPKFPPIAAAAQISPESLSKWPEIAASIISGSLNPEYSATLSALGDYLASRHLVEGAHACYLLSPQTSLMGGLDGPSTRLVLLGSQSPHINPIFFRDPDPIIFTEIAEFALSLKATTKGQEPFRGFPHLQAYKFIRATYLADIGHTQSATRYCEAITAVMSRPSPYFTPPLVEGLKQLADRLLGSPQMGKSTSWIGGKVNKPSLDSIGSWLEVRLTKFIAGDGSEMSPPASEPPKARYAGPFSSYSSISSATTSASPSPPPTVVNSHVPSVSSTVQPPRRSGSAMALPSTTMHAPVDRASSAMEYYRPTRHASPVPPKTAPLHSTRNHYSPSAIQSSAPFVANRYAAAYYSEPSSRKASLEMMAEPVSEEREGLQEQQEQHEEEPQQELTAVVDSDPEGGSSGGWWNSLGAHTDSSSTPTATDFHHVENVKELGEGFISLMDDPALSVTPNVATPSPPKAESTFDEADDLGLGNNAHSRPIRDESVKNVEDKPSSVPVQDTATNEQKQDPSPSAATSASSWLSRLWKRSDAPGPIRASLGEETSFYYDKELKRWVNKKAGTETSQPSAAPPPPSRAQTASPSVSSSRLNGMSNGTVASLRPPPPRTASAIDLSTPPTSRVPRAVRSDLVPTEVASMPNTPAPSPNPPPMGRSRSQATKKNVRSRYVDVFQQDGPSVA